MTGEVDYFARAHAHAEGTWEQCMIALDVEEEGGDGEWPEHLAGPFDGCQTCIVREVLNAAWPDLFAEAKQSIIFALREARLHGTATTIEDIYRHIEQVSPWQD